ncbi:MAG: hypothetical protein P1U42_00335 [Phycisphaerales bacterium]|nr:hypothetical protein [Phycisphaerales bacterium]
MTGVSQRNRTWNRHEHQFKAQKSKRRPIRKSFLIPVVASAFMLAGCNSFGPKIYESRSMQVPSMDLTPLRVTNANGWIKAVQSDRSDVGIEVELYGRDEERLYSTTVRADRLGDDTLRVWVEWPGGVRENQEGANISLLLPNADGIEARTSNGHITIIGLAGDAELNASNGAIRATRHDGSIHADTSNGSIQFESVSGDVEAYTSNGKVIITDAFGPVRVETSNGNVYVTTLDGNEGPLRIRTSNGRVDLDLGVGFQGVLKCETSNGRVMVDGIDDATLIRSTVKNHNTTSIEMKVGDSDEISAVRTSNGSVRVRSRHTEPVDD